MITLTVEKVSSTCITFMLKVTNAVVFIVPLGSVIDIRVIDSLCPGSTSITIDAC